MRRQQIPGTRHTEWILKPVRADRGVCGDKARATYSPTDLSGGRAFSPSEAECQRYRCIMFCSNKRTRDVPVLDGTRTKA
jgi:hypothetical protein